MRSGYLLGRQHPVQGAVAAVAEGPVAISLCRGGAPKTYSHTDPNEDAVCFAFGEHGVLAAVADGHYGARGAERVIEWLLEERAAIWTDTAAGPDSPEAWRETAAATLQALHRELIRQADELKLAPAPTTLSLALARPREGLLLHASIGDSHVFAVDAKNDSSGHLATDVSWASTGKRSCYFAGEQYEGGQLEERQWLIGSQPLAGMRAVLLASDGISELGIGVEDPAAAAALAVDHALCCNASLRPLEACRHLTAAALEAHRRNRAGDNICAAVIWLGLEAA